MGKRKKEPKLKGFEKVLATMPEYEGFRACWMYNKFQEMGEPLQDYLEVLFTLLKQHGTGDPMQKRMFFYLLYPAYKAKKDRYDLLYQNLYEKELPRKIDSGMLTASVCAVYQDLIEKNWGTTEQQALIRLRYDMLLEFLWPEKPARCKGYLRELLHPIQITKETVGQFGVDATASDIFEHLTFALRNDMSHVAHEVIGGLRYAKNKFPPAEEMFFYALVYMRDNSAQTLRRAITFMEKIPKDFRNYRHVLGMRAEAHARLGEPEYFENTAFEPDNGITELSMRGYLQLLVNNADLEAVGEDRLEAIFQKYYRYYGTGAQLENKEAPAERYSLAMQMCKENVLQAAKEVYGFYTQVVAVEQTQVGEEDMPISVCRARLLLRLSAKDVLEDLVALTRDNTPENRHGFVWRWFRVNPDPAGNVYEREVKLVLEAGRAIDSDEYFVEGFLADFDYISETEGMDLEYWLAEAYRAAIACDHPGQEWIYEQLQTVCPDSGAAYMQDRIYQKVRSNLGGHEKLLYAAAESAYQKAKKESEEYGWKDCGMVSLNFFRILEVELRERIFVKAFGSPENRAVIEEFCSKLRPYVLDWQAKKQNGQDASAERKLIRAKCGDLFDMLWFLEMLCTPQKMMLAGMFSCLRMLRDKCRVPALWQPYQDAMRQMVYDVLTEEGIEAVKDGIIEKTISDPLLKKYRNPPAHARYLPFEKAAECRDHVNETLLALHGEWLKEL